MYIYFSDKKCNESYLRQKIYLCLSVCLSVCLSARHQKLLWQSVCSWSRLFFMVIFCSDFTNNIMFRKNKKNGCHLRFMCKIFVKLLKRLNKNIIPPKSHIHFIKGLNEDFFINKITTAAILDFRIKCRSNYLEKTKIDQKIT